VLTRYSVVEERRLRFKIETFLQFVGFLFKSTERTFQKTSQRLCRIFKFWTWHFLFINLLMNVKNCYPSWHWQIMYESEIEKEDLLFESKSFCQLYNQNDAARCCISEVHKICDALHFLYFVQTWLDLGATLVCQSYPTRHQSDPKSTSSQRLEYPK